MSGTTTITVRALAFGGKFIGGAVGFAEVSIYSLGNDKPLASGLTNQGLLPNTDGSGVTELIMGENYKWGQPINASEASYFTAEIPLTEPTVLTFVAKSVADPRISVTCYRQVIPGLPLTGDMAVVLVMPGLLANLLSPTEGMQLRPGTSTPIVAEVRMMCGCKIEDHFWPVSNFDVKATIAHVGKTQLLTLKYAGVPSKFLASYSFSSRGDYEISVLATENNGNIGYAAPVTVTVK